MKKYQSLSIKLALSICNEISDKFGSDYPLLSAEAWHAKIFLINLSAEQQSWYVQVLAWRLSFQSSSDKEIEIVVHIDKGITAIVETESSRINRETVEIDKLAFDNTVVHTSFLKHNIPQIRKDNINWRLIQWEFDGKSRPIWMTPCGTMFQTIIADAETGEIFDATNFYQRQFNSLNLFVNKEDEYFFLDEPQFYSEITSEVVGYKDMISELSKFLPKEQLPLAMKAIDKSISDIQNEIKESVTTYAEKPRQGDTHSPMKKAIVSKPASIQGRKAPTYLERQKIEGEKKRKKRKRRYIMAILIVLGLFLYYWLKPCRDIDCLTSYFPLNVGNEYTYERKVYEPPMTNYPVQTQQGSFSMLGEENVQSGIEKFKIARKLQDEYIVEGQGIEPYGLEQTKQVVWAHRKAPGAFVIIHEGRKGNTTQSSSALSYLLVDPSNKIDQVDTGFTYENEYHPIFFINSMPYFRVLKCIKSYPAGRERSQVRVERYYVRGVGLVKEEQYNSGDKLSYTLTLKDYKIK